MKVVNLMKFPLNDFCKKSLVRRIIEWEKRGYEVCYPIKERTKEVKVFRYDLTTYSKKFMKNRTFSHNDAVTVYYTHMQKAGECDEMSVVSKTNENN